MRVGCAGGSSGGLTGARAPCGAWGVSWEQVSPGHTPGFSQGRKGNSTWQWFSVLLGPNLPDRLSLPLSQAGD